MAGLPGAVGYPPGVPFWLVQLLSEAPVASTVDRLATAADIAGAAVTSVSARHLRAVRRHWQRFPRHQRALHRVGLLPVVDHYYEPYPPAEVPTGRRRLPGLRLDLDAQVAHLEALRPWIDETARYADEPVRFETPRRFGFVNDTFGHPDAEVLYAMVRRARPRHVVEVGAGASTLLIRDALARNAADGCPGTHVCIEPYEHDWLRDEPVDLRRERLEDQPDEVVTHLGAGDVLFIDSSHVVRPGSDVLHEILVLLPQLQPGVLVHVHDIFTPYEYPLGWLHQERKLWHEQYVLEAFLSCNPGAEVVCALHLLAREAPDALTAAVPRFRPGHHVPGSFWFRTVAVG